jgi:hypothetical protein
MLIKLIDFKSKAPFYLDANNVRMVQRSADERSKLEKAKDSEAEKPLPVLVITYLMTPQGLQALAVEGQEEEIARMVNAAREGKNLLVS